MTANLFRFLRLALVAVVLGWAAITADAAPRPHVRHTATSYERTATDTEAKPERPPADPELGVLWIALGVGLLVFMIWVAARIGDNDR